MFRNGYPALGEESAGRADTYSADAKLHSQGRCEVTAARPTDREYLESKGWKFQSNPRYEWWIDPETGTLDSWSDALRIQRNRDAAKGENDEHTA